jgi:hypothetical protein
MRRSQDDAPAACILDVVRVWCAVLANSMLTFVLAPLLLCAQYDNLVTVMMRTAVAESEQIKQNAHATARRNTILAEAGAYAQVKDQLGLSAEELLAYRWYHTLMDSPSGKVLVNLAGGSIVNVAGGG